jgi:hypothetical protein
MLLLTSALFDTLKPLPGRNVKYYSSFVSQHMMVTTSTVVAQCNLMPEMFGESKQVIDEHVDGFIGELPESSEAITKNYKAYCKAMHIDPGKVIQENEPRFFASDSFEAKSKAYGISNRELVIRTLNASAFLEYFFLFESTITNIYRRKYQSANERHLMLGGKDVISKCLMGKLKRDGTEAAFFSDLQTRSQFFTNSSQLDSVWRLLNFIRNQQVHSAGIYSGRTKKAFGIYIDKICSDCDNQDEMTIPVNLLLDVLEPIQEHIERHGYILFKDSLENLMRNFSLFVMESLYLTEKHYATS